MNMSNVTKTINRGWLKKQLVKGNVEAKCDMRLTDDYAFDNATGFGKTEWAPARYVENKHQGDNRYEQNATLIDDWDFKTKSGCAYQTDDGLIHLIVYSGHSYSLRIK
jgi:hypothetical protein